MHLGELCQKFGVTLTAVKGHSRQRNIALKRKAIAYILRNKYCLSYPEIASLLNVDHSSVVYFVREINVLKNLLDKMQLELEWDNM